MTEPKQARSDRKIVIEREYEASVQDLWDLWTTKEGFESWWGPGGFAVEVHELDLRPNGMLRYAMTAVDPPQVQFLKQAGMRLTTEAQLTFTEIVPLKRLGYTHRVDFVPDVAPYDVGNKVEFFAVGDKARMVLTLDPMHSDEWTQRSVMGMESQLGKVPAALARRGGK